MREARLLQLFPNFECATKHVFHSLLLHSLSKHLRYRRRRERGRDDGEIQKKEGCVAALKRDGLKTEPFHGRTLSAVDREKKEEQC